jgi:hypothetical protein
VNSGPGRLPASQEVRSLRGQPAIKFYLNQPAKSKIQVLNEMFPNRSIANTHDPSGRLQLFSDSIVEPDS